MKSQAVLCCVFIGISNLLTAQNIPEKRAHHAMIYDENSATIKVTAGSSPQNGGSSFLFFDDVWSYDGTTWKKDGAVADRRSGVALAYDSKRNSIFSLGGFSNNNQCLSDLRELKDDAWTSVNSNPELTMAEGGFVYDSKRDRFIAFGGSSARGGLNSTTWIWDRKTWSKLEGPSPEGRQAFAMIYDSKRDRVVAFGGMGATPQSIYGDTWEFDGEKWTKVSSDGPARMSMGYAYDSRNAQLVIFGGASPTAILGDTWAWDGKEWKQLSTEGPTPRMMGYMAYDKKRNKIVMFGGRLGWPNDANDTWEWDGHQWKKIM
jgi:hypothetical protein